MPGSVIISSARTPIGKLSGALASFSAMDLGGFAVAAALERGGVGPEQVDYVILGQVLQGGQGQITARQAAVKAGVPMTVPALTVNKVCLSGMNAIYLIPVNLYGPGDNFDPGSSHVIPALIKKCVDARESGAGEIEVWGTGNASREFLFVGDAAEGIALAADRYDGADPVNLGVGREITIRELVKLIVGLTGFDGTVLWNSSLPDGQPRRALDTVRAREAFGFVARTGFEDGLRRTIEWYEEHRRELTPVSATRAEV